MGADELDGRGGLGCDGFPRRCAAAARASSTRRWTQGFAKDGTIREKYNVVSGNANVQVSAGYKTNVIGFGWTNAVYLKMKEVVGGQVKQAAD